MANSWERNGFQVFDTSSGLIIYIYIYMYIFGMGVLVSFSLEGQLSGFCSCRADL